MRTSTMATEVPTPNSLPATRPNPKQEDKRHRSIFDVPRDFFDSCRILLSPSSSFPITELPFQNLSISAGDDEVEANDEQQQHNDGNRNSMQRWSCNTCKAEFDSLEDQRSHFKSDLHRFNIKLSIAGKDVLKEEDFDDPTCDSLSKDYDISSISGSEEEEDKESHLCNDMGLSGSVKRKIFVRLHSGDKVSVWKCLLLDDSEHITFENDQFASMGNGGYSPQLTEGEAVEKLKYLVHENRDNTRLRVVLLARGGHFAGCVFDGNSVVAHKTFHRYVVRAKAGKKQSSKDASGKAAHSAGAALRRYNELALKKEIQELLATWKPYLDATSCVFIHAPSNNRQLLFDGEKPSFSFKHCAVRSVPLIVRRPTLKEAKRIYKVLTQVCYENDEYTTPAVKEMPLVNASIVSDGQLDSSKEDFRDNLKFSEITASCSNGGKSESLLLSSEGEDDVTGTTTSLHEAAKSGNVQKVLELLEDGLDPSNKDERGKTPYMLAVDKEVRNTFRRFMASNPDKWDWNAAKVPSALTKEMEESQAAKQAVKDAKRKARLKELKKLRKAREKKAQAQEAQSQGVPNISSSGSGTALTIIRKQSPTTGGAPISKEEELKRAQDAEREKRAAAAERRIAAAAASRVQGTEANTPAGNSPSQIAGAVVCCSCCNASLAGKIPFHRYNYKYCSSSCMHVHKEILDDG